MLVVQPVYNTLIPYDEYAESLNPLSIWRFGESTGATTVVDEMSYASGTYVNVPVLETPSLIPSNTDTAVRIVGASSDIVHVGIASQFRYTPTTPFSIVTVAKFESGFSGTIVSKGSGSGGIYEITIQADKKLLVRLRDNDMDYIMYTTDTVLADGAAYHIGMSYNGNQLVSGLKLYINGVDHTTGTQSSSGPFDGVQLDPANIVVYVGSRVSQNRITGTIDDTMIFNRVVTPTEMFNLHKYSGI